jgi:hypothetical protein
MNQDFGNHLLFDLTQSFFQINKGSRKPWHRKSHFGETGR